MRFFLEICFLVDSFAFWTLEYFQNNFRLFFKFNYFRTARCVGQSSCWATWTSRTGIDASGRSDIAVLLCLLRKRRRLLIGLFFISSFLWKHSCNQESVPNLYVTTGEIATRICELKICYLILVFFKINALDRTLFRTGRPDFPVRPTNVASLRRRLLIEHNVMLQIAKPYLSKVFLDFDRKNYKSDNFFLIKLWEHQCLSVYR